MYSSGIPVLREVEFSEFRQGKKSTKNNQTYSHLTMTEEVHLDEEKNEVSPNSSFTSPRHVGEAGKFRYLKPAELEKVTIPYDFAVIANRMVKVSNYRKRWCSPEFCISRDEDEENRIASPSSKFGRLCLVNSPLLQESEDEHRRIVEKLCAQGLIVDIIDGGHSEGEMTSDYFILLIRASDDVVNAYARSFRKKLWIEHGNVFDLEVESIEVEDYSEPATPAERIEIVDYIVEERANLSVTDPWIHDMFPVHDEKISNYLIKKWVSSWNLIELNSKPFIDSVRYNFGEKVAYYFAFVSFYNKGILPLACLGFVLQILHNLLPTVTYMRILPFWAIIVCVIWPFFFLRYWDQRNTKMQFEWNEKLNVKQVQHPNKHFFGKVQVDPLTGETVLFYPHWKRFPKYFCVFIFMVLQTVIMLMLVALWVSIYELLKVKYSNDSSIFSTQWFLILGEGIIFGLFVDVIQWNIVVTKFGRLFTHWENYRTEEAYERALIRKLFVMDFLNYYTWFFSLAFVYVIPGCGDYLTNTFNHLFFGDAMNCCFGPYFDEHLKKCISCPHLFPTSASQACIECVGWFTFDIHHVDISAMFVTPIIVTQSLNMLLALIIPIITKIQRERARAKADADAQKRVMEAGSMKILGSLEYENQEAAHFGNKSNSRYLEFSASEIEVLNKKAREILFESEQDSYDPYNDFHTLTVQFGFTVMFSILWPLMPLACMVINSLKLRADSYRLCRTLKRPFPRKANGIGHWRSIFSNFAYVAVIVNVLLICVSTGCLEFFNSQCIRDIEHQLSKKGHSLSDFIFGPDFGCFDFKWRLLLILLFEHLFLLAAFAIVYKIPGVPDQLKRIVDAREKKFKLMISDNSKLLPLEKKIKGKKSTYINIGPTIDLKNGLPSRRASGGSYSSTDIGESGSFTPTSISSNQHEGKIRSRENLARKWSDTV